MNRLRYLLAILSSFMAAGAAAADDGKVSFVRDVAPILVQHCAACHGPTKAENNYRLDTFERAAKAGENETAPLTAGKLDDSGLYDLISSTDPKERMPKDADPLSADEIALVRRWIEQGAKFDGPDPKASLASIIPRVPHPDPPAVYRRPFPVTALAFAPSGNEILVGGYHEITVWNVADGQLVRRLKNIPQRTHAIRFTKDGSLVAIAGGTPGRSGEVKLIRPDNGAEVKLLGTMADEAFDLAISPDGAKLAAVGADRAIHVYDLAGGKEERTIENHADWVMAVAWSGDGSHLASASRDKTAKVFDAKTGELVATYSGHGQSVYGVAFHGDGKQVYTSGADNKIHLWKIADGARAADVGGFGGEVYKLVADNGQLFSTSADKTAKQHVLADRRHVRDFSHGDTTYAVAVHAATKRVATAGYDGRVRLWSLDDGKPLTTFVAAPK